MNKTPRAIMFVGLPGSGKSTIYNNFYKDAYKLVSSDAIIERIAVRNNVDYNESFKQFSKISHSQVIADIKDYAANNDNFVIDMTNLTVDSRKKKLDLIPNHYYIAAIVFNAPDEEQHQQILNSRAGKTIPKHIMESMAKSFVMPTHNERFDSIMITDYIKFMKTFY